MGCAFESSEVIGSREAYKMGYPKECNICIQKNLNKGIADFNYCEGNWQLRWWPLHKVYGVHINPDIQTGDGSF